MNGVAAPQDPQGRRARSHSCDRTQSPRISPLDSNKTSALPQPRLYPRGAHEAKRPFHLPGVSHRTHRLWDVLALLRLHTRAVSRSPPVPASPSMLPWCLCAPPVPPRPCPAPVPAHRAPSARPGPSAPPAASAATSPGHARRAPPRVRHPAAPERGMPGVRVPPRRTTAPTVQRGRAPRPLAAVAAPTGWVGTSADPGTRRRAREAAEPGEHGGARVARASLGRARRVSGRPADGHHRPQVLGHSSLAPSASPHTVPAALVPCPPIAAEGGYRSVRSPTGHPAVVGEWLRPVTWDGRRGADL